MSNRRSAGSHRSLWQQQKRRWRLSGLTLVILGVPVAMAALAGTVFAAGVFGRGGHHRPPGAMASASAPAQAAAAVNPNCTLVVPANPLTAQGLATPYQLTATNPAGGACHEANANQSAFVEAAILTSNGQLTLYDPLVVDQGTQPAAAPVPAQVPAGSTVGIWFGFNGTNLTLQSAGGTNSLTQGNCVNGQGASVFGQFAYCNAAAFFSSANTQIANNQLQIPAAGTAKDGMPCPTVRDFSVVDQDQSDNVVTHYLATAGGQTAQNNAANQAALAGTTDLANASDNLLLTKFVDPALGCTPLTKPDQSSDGQATGALPLDELSAAANQQAPIALVPMNDPMTLVNAAASAAKTNLYRTGVDQPQTGAAAGAAAADTGNGTQYCQNMFGNAMGIPRIFKDQAMLANAPSPDAAMATNLFTFLGMRANQSFTNLNCNKLLNAPDPVTLTTNGNGVVTAATFTPLGQQPPAANPGAGAGAGAGTGASAPASASATASAPATAIPSAGAAPSATTPGMPSASAPAAPSTSGAAAPTATATSRPPRRCHW